MRGHRNSARVQVDPALVDQMLDLYCDWRTECAAVRQAYECISGACGSERALAFAAYCAALDREGLASDVYEAQVRLIRARAVDASAIAHSSA